MNLQVQFLMLILTLASPNIKAFMESKDDLTADIFELLLKSKPEHKKRIWYDAQSQNWLGLWKGVHVIPNQSHYGKEAGDGTDGEATVN